MEIQREALLPALEAMLFAYAEPLEEGKIAQVLEKTEEQVGEALQALQKKYNKETGIVLVRLDNAWQLCSNPAFAAPVREILEVKRNTPLSQAALEVLAVVAYNQPVTKAFIEQVRGVDCSGVLNSLSAKGLVEEKGRLELPGRPLLYGTTPDFLRSMQISSLEDLPPLPKEEKEEPLPTEDEDPS